MKTFILLTMLCVPLAVFAQSKTVTGTVLDEYGDSVIGASVLVQGTTNGTITDFDGKFSLSNVPENATLTVMYMGYISQSFPAAGKTTFTVTLKEDVQALDDVVVIGYGSVSRSNTVGSIANISAEKFEDRPVARVEQALQGQMAGVSVRSTSGSPGSDIQINVRGAASINGESTPLYVVDGVPVDNLSSINMNDVQSIDVLKDAASAAIYGSRGSNGVVIITTKRGKTGKPTITLDAYAAVSTRERKVNVMNSDEWIQFNKKWYDRQWVNETGQSAGVSQADRIAYAAAQEGKSLTSRSDLSTYRTKYGLYDPWWGTDEIESIDWQDELFRTAPTYNVQLSAAGATDKVSYLLSGGVYTQDGIVHGSSFDRYSFRANVDAQMTDRIKVGITLAPSYSAYTGANVDGKDNAVARALSFPGWVLAGSGRMAGADPYKFYGDWGAGPNNVSPYVQATGPERKKGDSRMNSSFTVDVDIIDGLKASGLASWNYRSYFDRTYTPTWVSGTWDSAEYTGQRSSSNYETIMYNKLLFQGLLTYNKSFGAHDLDVLLGISQESENTSKTVQNASDFPNDKSWVFNKDKGTLNKSEVTYVNSAIQSYFGRIQYGYLNRYLVTATLRRDGSSKFGSDNRWGWFPSVAGAWKINEEEIMRAIDWLGTAKLRVSWGQAGNDRIGEAQFLANMSSLNYVTGGGVTSGYVVNNIANSLLGWETTTSYNIGVDFGVLANRIYFSAYYYKKTTKDLLLKAPVSLITGFSDMMDNVGNVDNWGMEFLLETSNIETRDFKWNSSLNISFNRNKITSLGNDNSDIRLGQGNTVIQRVGHPINSYMLLEVERTLRAADFEADGVTPKKGIAIYSGQQAGDSKWVDQNGDGVINSDDYVVAGSYQPKFEWGFSNTFKYKDFDLSVLLQGRVGGDLLSIGSRGWNRATNGPGWNYMNRWLYDAYWSEDEPGDGMTPGFFSTVTGNQYDTNWLYSATYLRIKNITLGYVLPLKPNNVISRLRVYASCDNVYLWDKYDPGFSPEAGTQDNNAADWGSYPLARTFSFGVNITF